MVSHDDNGKQTATPQPHIPNPSNISPKNHQSAKFDPTRCIIVNLTIQFTIAYTFNQDQIQRVINDIHGPIIIEKIVPYKYQTNKPKIPIQFTTDDKAKRIVSAWKSNAFEGSTARLTINPQELNKLSCMMKGVPLSATDEEIQADVKRLDEHATTFRLFKDETKLRTVHIQFQNKLQFDNTIQDDIHLISLNLLCKCETIE